jgi:hypothetical protein
VRAEELGETFYQWTQDKIWERLGRWVRYLILEPFDKCMILYRMLSSDGSSVLSLFHLQSSLESRGQVV